MVQLTLAPYQQTAFNHLLGHPRAALFMGLGLGKTSTTLAAVEASLLMGTVRAALVVAPLRVCNLTWPAEVEKWGFGLKVANLRTAAGWEALRKQSAQLYLINYEALPKLVEKYLKVAKYPAFDCVVFDELTRAKNHASKRINQFRRYLDGIGTRWGLTGTPTPNSYLELFAQIRLLDDGQRLGKSFDQFRRGHFHATDYMEYDWEINAGAKEAIQKRIADIALTLRSSDFLDIPDMVEEDVEVLMPEDARKVYDFAEKEMLLRLAKDDLPIANAAVLAGKLLQMAGGAVYDDVRAINVLHEAKIKALGHEVKQPGPLLVACNYIHERQRVKAAFPQTVDFAEAKTPSAQIALAQKWNAGQMPLLMADPRSIGHGLNLQDGGSRICWFSPTWSRELYDQMNARLFRRGQVNAVRVTRILCPGTIDDAVVETLQTRGDDQSALLAALKNLQILRQNNAGI